MIESIADQIKAGVFDNLDWITRSGGLTELVEDTSGETPVRRPWARILEDGVRSYVDVTPDGNDACIAFVDFPSDMTVETERSKYRIVVLRPRIVVWCNEDKIEYSGDLEKQGGMVTAINNLVRGLSINALSTSRIVLESMSVDAGRIWSGYNFRADDALFVAPYRTFALTFRLRGYQMFCADPALTAIECC